MPAGILIILEDADMKMILERRLEGSFLGYGCGRVYRLADGTVWHQEGDLDEPCYRESPGCRLLLDDTGRTYLDVDGTSGIAWVEKGEMRRPASGSF